jgi:FkbM family methyltransferase
MIDFPLTRIPLFGLWPNFAILDGVRVPIRHSPLSPRARRHLMRGGYETAERHVLALLLDEGDHVLELGASIGIVSSILWKKVGPHGRVLSVEANDALRAPFERQMVANHLAGEWVEALCCPVWGQSIPASILTQRFVGTTSNLTGAADNVTSTDTKSRWLTAGQICDKYRMKPTALMIDVEGSEAVWGTMSPRFPLSVRAIVVEIHPWLIGADRAGLCVQALIEEGFRIVAIYGTVFGFRRC